MLKSRDSRLPSPTYMSEEQKAKYLKDLRSRPIGSRPPPPSKVSSLKWSGNNPVNQLPEASNDAGPQLHTRNSMPIMSPPDLSHHRTDSKRGSRSPFVGRPIARPPPATPSSDNSSSATDSQEDHVQTTSRPTSMVYMERGSRWMERQETRSLRQALEDMDLTKETKIFKDAQDEAAELVWKHQNKDKESASAPYRNPDKPKDYRSHLRKGSYRRSFSQDRSLPPSDEQSAGGGQPADAKRKISPPSATMNVHKKRSPSGKSYGGLAEAVANDIEQAQRRVSSGNKRIFSGEKKAFMKSSDKIWEDPQEEAAPTKNILLQDVEIKPPTLDQPAFIRKNPFARVRSQHPERLERMNSAPDLSPAKRHTVEIQRNPPSQSRNPFYTFNNLISSEYPEDEPAASNVVTIKDGVEVRGDDIRAATSKRRTDRSPNLPQPSMVSDRAGRPIVSFSPDWTPKEKSLEEIRRPMDSPSKRTSTGGSEQELPKKKSAFNPEPMKMPPQMSSSGSSDLVKPSIPMLNLPTDETPPSRTLSEVPEIVTPASGSEPVKTRADVCDEEAPGPLNMIPALRSRHGQPPLPQRPIGPGPCGNRKAVSSPLPKSTPHYTPSICHSGTLCAHCALPIAGRVLSAAGERFHPSCFVCHQCETNLELVAFYPEPDRYHSERLERIQARQAGLPLVEEQTMSTAELQNLQALDGEPALRFYCHLDYHELFSPRCKSCKTPIEGEVIVACGAEWHAGHFFCAQCGDPFDSTTPFVEKDGYAWCVGCHTHRYSSKCRKCRKPVTDIVVKALGSDWHDRCFVCTECNCEFEDGRYFLRGEEKDPVCVKCEERRLKA